MSPIPSILTPRLRLRAHETEDYPDCVAMWSDPAVCRHTIGEPSTPQRTWIRLTSYLGHWQLLGYGYWAVEEKESGRYIGELGFADFKRGVEASLEGIPEIGWALATYAHRKGYATEALQAVVAWGDKRFNGAKTICLITPDNLPSIRVAERIGYKRERATIKNDHEVILFTR